jgi:hypothetical protein
MSRDWPFDDAPNVSSYTTVNVLERGAPILLVTYDADDGAWQFLCGKTNDPADGRVIGLDCALGLDPTIAQVADLPSGWRAWRDTPGGPWSREPSPPDQEE